MGIQFETTPEVFGSVHLLILAGILLAVFGLFFILRRRNERQLRTLIGVLGIMMILAEVWKQWFVRVYVYPGILSFWFFPWQLCSMAMYVSAALLIAKDEAEDAGWKTEGLDIDEACPGKSIGGDRFGNREGLLPKAKGRTWYECDIDYRGGRSRGPKRIVYSSDGLIYYTEDHYESFQQLY